MLRNLVRPLFWLLLNLVLPQLFSPTFFLQGTSCFSKFYSLLHSSIYFLHSAAFLHTSSTLSLYRPDSLLYFHLYHEWCCTHVSGERFGTLHVATTDDSGLLRASVETRWFCFFLSCVWFCCSHQYYVEL